MMYRDSAYLLAVGIHRGSRLLLWSSTRVHTILTFEALLSLFTSGGFR